MAASFRSVDQIFSLAGLDLLTISPSLLTTMMELPPPKNLTSWTKNIDGQESQFFAQNQTFTINQVNFSNTLTSNEMAKEKLIEGINMFNTDAKKLVAAIDKVSRKT